jgi:hypothetical protein
VNLDPGTTGAQRRSQKYNSFPWHGRGRRFDPDQVHHIPQQLIRGEVLHLLSPPLVDLFLASA